VLTPWTNPSDAVDFDYLITKKKIERTRIGRALSPHRLEFRTDALIDPTLPTLEAGTVVQFERKGFYILDLGSTKQDGSTAGAELSSFRMEAATVTSKAGAKETVRAKKTPAAPQTEGARLFDVTR